MMLNLDLTFAMLSVKERTGIEFGSCRLGNRTLCCTLGFLVGEFQMGFQHVASLSS